MNPDVVTLDQVQAKITSSADEFADSILEGFNIYSLIQ